jgi:hypothetical protein
LLFSPLFSLPSHHTQYNISLIFPSLCVLCWISERAEGGGEEEDDDLLDIEDIRKLLNYTARHSSQPLMTELALFQNSSFLTPEAIKAEVSHLKTIYPSGLKVVFLPSLSHTLSVTHLLLTS